MAETKNKPDKKTVLRLIPEIAVSAVLCIVLVVLFSGWAKTLKMPSWYSYTAAGLSLALFIIALVSTVFVTGRELRNATNKIMDEIKKMREEDANELKKG